MRRPRLGRMILVTSMIALAVRAAPSAGAPQAAPAGSAADQAPRPAPTPPGPNGKATAARPDPREVAEETRALDLVREQLPQLAEVLGPLKTSNPAEYRKAITALAEDARNLAETRSKAPARYPFALDSWKARTRVELVAAQLARAPSAERENQLRTAIRERVQADIRRHRFEAEQAEAGVVRSRDNLAKAEANRDRTRAALQRAEKGIDARVEARFQALVPRSKATTTPPQTATGPTPPIASPTPND